jgi:putative PIG3 family NAD(P)H quinone oxidoreductase
VRAITITSPGDADVLVPADVDDPVPGPGEVLLDVAATAVNRADVMQRAGFYDPPPGASPYPGLECSGRIAELGDGVTGWSVGDAVCALLSGGGYATRVAVPAGQLLPVPAGLTLEQAAALPEVACTVWSNVFSLAGLRAGEVLLVHGGTSGIGTMAVQLAARAGARVLCTVGSAEKASRAVELGAERAVLYRDEDFVAVVREVTGGAGADVVLDNMGAAYLPRNVEVLAVGGRLVVIGLQGGTRGELDLGALLASARRCTRRRCAPARPRRRPRSSRRVREHVWPAVEAGRGAARSSTASCRSTTPRRPTACWSPAPTSARSCCSAGRGRA